MTSVVRPRLTRSSASWISCSVNELSAEVASSRTRIGGPLRIGAGDRDALLLAARELQPALPDRGLVAFRQGRDEAVDLGEVGCRADVVVRGFPAPVLDIVADGVVEQHRVLRNHADRRPQARLRHLGDVLAVDQDAAARRLVEAEQEARDRRLAGAGRADDGDRAPRRHLEAHPLRGSRAPAHRRSARPRSARGPPLRRAVSRPAGPRSRGSSR